MVDISNLRRLRLGEEKKKEEEEEQQQLFYGPLSRTIINSNRLPFAAYDITGADPEWGTGGCITHRKLAIFMHAG